MNSTLTDDDRRATRMKPKSGNKKFSIDGTATTVVRDETRSILNFSRENLNISESELEQGFNKSTRCFPPSRHNILSLIAICVALACVGIEIWKLHRVVSNSRDIEIMKRDIESLRLRSFGEDFMDELKAFEEQLYGEDSDADEDSSEADIEGADYDNNYDEDYSPNEYASDSSEPATSTQSLVIRDSRASTKSEESKSTSLRVNRELAEMLAVFHKAEAKRGQEMKSIQENRHNISRKRLLDENHDEPREISEDHPKRRRAVTEETPLRYTNVDVPIFVIPSSSHDRNRTRNEKIFNNESNDLRTVKKRRNKIATTEAVPWYRHAPKKYYAVTFPTSRRAFRHHRTSLSHRKDPRRLKQGSELTRRSLKARVITRRHLRAPRQVFAAHYGADSTLFGIDDEHTGNGRAKHNEGIFKAWRASEWVTDLGMSKHFGLSRDGRLTVHESGLYLVYGQIHYLDEHDENGFHMLVNGQPILQCMVYSPGIGHKSRSCFSAQITILQAGDRLVLKDVGPARYTLFQHDKSFFGLVKLGDSRQQQPKHTTQETRR